MTSIKNKHMKICFIIIFFTLFLFSSNADRLGIPGFESLFIDFPESFEVTQISSDKKSYQLENNELNLSYIIKTYGKSNYGTCQRALDDTISKLKLSGTSKTVLWSNQYCSLATIQGKINNTDIFGLSECVSLPYDKGYVVLIGWCKKSDEKKLRPAIESLMDSICIDQGSYMGIGLYTKAKYYDSPSNEKKIQLTIDEKIINTQIKLEDITQAQYVVEREYSLLTMYQNSKKWQEAWIRYYRMIFKDSYERLSRCAFDIYNSLKNDCSDETALAQKILYWTQTLPYQREKTGSDFTCLPGIISGQGNDCDGRSMLIAVLLTHMNQDAVIFVSSKHSHAMAGFISSHPGRSFDVNGKKYLMGETTQQGLTWGTIAQSMSNQKDWITVTFP